MRIRKLRITNYKSILDSGEVDLNPAITVLVGRNESGKTSILRALESFRKDREYVENDVCLYSPARNEIFTHEKRAAGIEMIKIWFSVEDGDRDGLSQVDPEYENATTIVATKYYDNAYRIEVPESGDKPVWHGTRADNDRRRSALATRANEFKIRLDDHARRHGPFSESTNEHRMIVDDFVSSLASENQDFESTVNQTAERLGNLTGTDEEIDKDIEAFVEGLKTHGEQTRGTTSLNEKLLDKMLGVLPNIIYFSDVETIEDSLPIAEFLAHPEKHKTLSNLIELAGLDVERVKDAEDYAMLSDLRVASANITGLLNQSWTQEAVQVNTSIVRDRIVISIVDKVIGKDHRPSIRSQGFRWFLSFYINFVAGSSGELKNTLVLLDDLGMFLHPSGQKDLIRTLETISASNQIVYSTHSPYMIDKSKRARMRLIQKKEGKGTTIRVPPSVART
jgi:hypothetical protein